MTIKYSVCYSGVYVYSLFNLVESSSLLFSKCICLCCGVVVYVFFCVFVGVVMFGGGTLKGQVYNKLLCFFINETIDFSLEVFSTKLKQYSLNK